MSDQSGRLGGKSPDILIAATKADRLGGKT